VLTADGTLLNRDTTNWAPWKPAVGSNADSLEVIRRRRRSGEEGAGLPRFRAHASPSVTSNVRYDALAERWRDHRIAAVFHSAWQASLRRFGAVFRH